MDTIRVVMAIVAVVAVILQRISHRVILEVADMEEIAILIGGRTRIIGETMIEGHHHQMPTPSASFLFGCDVVAVPSYI